jgi:uncharacterized protein YqeY
MDLHKKINEEAKKAMLAKDETRLMVLKSIKASFMNEIIAKKMTVEFLPDDISLTILKKLSNQRKDSIDQFKKGNRPDLVKVEEAELKIIEEYLPKMMSDEDILKIAKNKKEQMDVTDKSKLGVLVGAVMKETKGLADGALVKKIVESLFE